MYDKLIKIIYHFRRWKDCLIFNFSHFNITLAGDYVVALLMISIMLSVSVSL